MKLKLVRNNNKSDQLQFIKQSSVQNNPKKKSQINQYLPKILVQMMEENSKAEKRKMQITLNQLKIQSLF